MIPVTKTGQMIYAYQKIYVYLTYLASFSAMLYFFQKFQAWIITLNTNIMFQYIVPYLAAYLIALFIVPELVFMAIKSSLENKNKPASR